jgi:hypothetical protein
VASCRDWSGVLSVHRKVRADMWPGMARCWWAEIKETQTVEPELAPQASPLAADHHKADVER